MVFVEEGIRSGGFGEYAAALARTRGCRAQAMVFAAEENFAAGGKALGTRAQLLKNSGLDGAGIADRVCGAR